MNPEANQLTGYINEYETWKLKSPGSIEGLSEFATQPIEMVSKKIIPTKIGDQVADALFTIIEKTILSSEKLITDDQIIEEIRKHDPSIATMEDIRNSQNIAAMNKAALSFIESNTAFAAARGEGAGAKGLLGLPLNIPALFTAVFRMIQQICSCYGFDYKRPEEKDFILKILSISASTKEKEKNTALRDIELSDAIIKAQYSAVATETYLKQTEIVLLKQSWNEMDNESALVKLRNSLKSIGFQLTKKKALQMIPAISAIIGAVFDSVYTNDVGIIANLFYRQRRINTQSLEVTRVEYDNPRETLDKNNAVISKNDDLSDRMVEPALEPLSESTRIIVQFLVLIALSDDYFDKAEKSYILETVRDDIGEDLSEDAFQKITDEVREKDLTKVLSNYSKYDQDFKESLILMGMVVSMVDGKVVPEESALIYQACQMFQISPEKFKELNKAAFEIYES
ncbi:EcsC family protein [bacterium]|nr:EcsC family protein [bacterium]